MIDRIRQSLIPVSVTLCLFAGLIFGLWIQDAADPLMMMPLALMGVWLASTGRLLRVSLRDPILLGLMLLWLLWGASAIHSDFPFNSKVTWIIMSTLPISYIVWRAATLSERWQNYNQILFLLAGVGLGVGALLQATIMPQANWGGRPGYPFADPNMLGIFLSLSLLPLIPLVITDTHDKRLRVVLGLALLILTAGLFATESRSAFLGTAAGTGLILLLLRHHIAWTKQKLIGLGVALSAVAVTVIASGFIQRFISIFQSGGDKDVNGRLSLWKSAFSMSMNHPFTGYGFGTFGLYYPIMRERTDNSAGWWVHMDPLQWAVESGWITPIVFYCLVVYIVIRVWQQASAKALSPFQIGCAGALLCLFLNAHTAYPLHVTAFMIMATGMLAMLVPVTDAPVPATRTNTIFASALLLALLLIFWSGLRVGSTLQIWKDLNDAKANHQEETFNQSLDDCIKIGDPQFAFCKFMVIEVELRGPKKPDDTIIKKIDDTRTYNPALAQPDFYMGMYYLRAIPPKLNEAIESFQKSLNNNPTFYPSSKALVTALLQSGRYMDALKASEKAANYPIPISEMKNHEEMYKNIRKMVYPQ